MFSLKMLVPAVLAVSSLLSQATPVDVDGDGVIGPLELIDLSLHWKDIGTPQFWQSHAGGIFFNSGKVGIGTDAPAHQLRIAGGPLWTSNSWTGSLELNNGSAIGWNFNSAAKSFGIGQSTGGLYFFHTTSSPGTATNIANYDMMISDNGRVGIGSGASSPLYPLTINTGGSGYGWVHTDGTHEIGSYVNNSGGWLGTHSNHPLHFFTNDSLPKMTLTTSGVLGVGTTTPNAATRLNAFTSADGNQAVRGDAPNGNGIVGTSSKAGYSAAAGINTANNGIGVYGESNTGLSAYGVWGKSDGGIGIYGQCASAQSNDSCGVFGRNNATNGNGIIGECNSGFSAYGVYGRSSEGAGVYGEGGFYGVRGIANTAGGYGVYGTSNNGGYAGYFYGKVVATGGVTQKGISSSIMDHPLDPENKSLLHYSTEGPEPFNVYRGNILLDSTGTAWVGLPDYFESINRDPSYILTPVGSAMPNLYVAKEIENNHFQIAGGTPDGKVSWQVTGTRDDLYERKYPTQTEVTKDDQERGKYHHPDLYGQPDEKGIHYRPEMQQSHGSGK
jgi:hypothetical protein